MYLSVKKIFLITTISVVSFQSLAAPKVEVDIPLRLSSDRAELVEQLSREENSQINNPVDVSEIEATQRETMLTEKALQTAAHDPKEQFRTILIDSNARMKAEDIYLSPNFSTTLIFMDKKGESWPIDSYIRPIPKEKLTLDVLGVGMISLTPKTYAGKGNFVLKFKDRPQLLMLNVNIGIDKVDYLTEIRLDEYGPNSKRVVYSKSGATSNYRDLSSMAKFEVKDKYSLIDGIIPDGYRKRETTDSSVVAWSKGNTLFVKTKYQFMSRLIENDEFNVVKGVDGSYLYTAPFVSPISVLSAGTIHQVYIK